MDKDDLQHLQDYREQVKYLHVRLNIVNELIKPLEIKENESKETDTAVGRVNIDG